MFVFILKLFLTAAAIAFAGVSLVTKDEFFNTGIFGKVTLIGVDAGLALVSGCLFTVIALIFNVFTHFMF